MSDIRRKEINIISGQITSTTANSSDVSGRINFDAAKYSGALTIYFEIEAQGDGTGNHNVRLINVTSTQEILLNTTSSMTLIRSSALTSTQIANLQGDNYIFMAGAVSGTTTLKAARLIILQDCGTSPLTATESQFEIGNRELAVTVTTVSVLQKLAAPKYWKYEAANFDGNCTFYAECTYLVSSTTGNKTIVIQEATTAEPTATWTTVATMLNASTGSVTTARVRSTSFTPVDGRYYRLAHMNTSTMSTISLYNAKIIIDQSVNTTATYAINGSVSITDTGNSWTNDANAFDGNTGTAATPTATTNQLRGLGTTAPASNTQTIASVQFRVFLSSGNSSLLRALFLYNSADQINPGSDFSANTAAGWSQYFTITPPAGGWTWTILSGVGAAFTMITGTICSVFESEILVTYQNITEITKTEDHYLLANTTLAAGTALQNFLAKWDSTEWSGVTNIHIHQLDAGDNNTSVVELDGITSGSPVTNSSVSSPDNYKQSTSALTMPSSQNLDVKATTNSGNIFGSRIIVKSVKVVVTSNPFSYGYVIN